MRALSVPGDNRGEAESAEAPQQGSVPLRAQAAFPKAARLLKTDEFSSVFRLRPWRRTAHFVVYGRPTGNDARLGLVHRGPSVLAAWVCCLGPRGGRALTGGV